MPGFDLLLIDPCPAYGNRVQVSSLDSMSTTIILLSTLLSAAIILILTLKNKHNLGASGLRIFCIAVSITALANYFIYHPNVFLQSVWFAVFYLGLRVGYLAIFIYAIQYTFQYHWLNPATLFIFALEPIIAQLIFWTNQMLGSADSIALHSIWIMVGTLYTNCLLLLALFLLAQDFNYRPMLYRNQTKFIMAGIAFSLLMNNIIGSTSSVSIQDLKTISLLTFGPAFILGFFFTGKNDITPITRESVVEYMSDGWVVLDNANRIVDVNAAAEKITGFRADKITGKPAEEIFIGWPNLMNSLNDTHSFETKGSVQINGERTYLNINISPLVGMDLQRIGKLIVWRDITQSRLADESRQLAREEMFILLHAITSAASRALNLDDFLSEAIYQIVFSSRSQAIAVYLLDEHERPSYERKLVLTAQHGMPLQFEDQFRYVPESLELVAWVFEHGEPLLIPNIQTDPRIPTGLQELGSSSLLLIPMAVEGNILGLIGLTKTVDATYSSEEVVRLSAITNEVAIFIYSHRQRQLSIALAERQRLVRDLHDSVTQKLYGLVTLSEATQAGIKAGVADMPARVIGQMAENARQALKEMRLFLFQLQPVDFTKDGLAATIQHRLSTVEGRADINARLVADEIISIPLEKELALYFIAQEALNNILKHAKAKKILVTLKNEQSYFILEVEDNGCGFDLNGADTGGIGMKSMRERAAQIGGKLIISSTPGSGTKITVTLKINSWNGK